MVDDQLVRQYQEEQEVASSKNNKDTESGKPELIQIIAGVVLVAILVAGVFYWSRREKEEPIVVPEDAVYQVGADFFSAGDIDYMASFMYGGKNYAQLAPSEQSGVHKRIAERSAALQEAKKQKLVSIDDALFGTNKNWRAYNEAFENVISTVNKKSAKISVAGVTIFFHNHFNEIYKGGLEEAKRLTREKMEQIRKDLITGAYSIKNAGTLVSKDTTLEQFDSAYYLNAYAEFHDIPRGGKIFVGMRKEDSDRIWQLKPGEFSPIIMGYQGWEGEPWESFWGVYQVMKKEGEGKTYTEWVASILAQYQLKYVES